MRLELSGGVADLAPLSLQLQNGVPFLKAPYLDQGYGWIEILCIGASGGDGGVLYTSDYTYGGGGGGGGGCHYIKKVLADLPSSAAVVINPKGTDGAVGSSPTAGTDGGYVSFAGTLCRASGGKGGGPGTEISPTNAYGGEGGTGNSVTAGGGGPQAAPYAQGNNGGFDGNIGQGGSGGGGGRALMSPEGVIDPAFLPGYGGKGAYDIANTAFSAPGGSPVSHHTLSSINPAVIGGKGGGARSTFLNQLLMAYGGGAGQRNGAIFVRLTT